MADLTKTKYVTDDIYALDVITKFGLDRRFITTEESNGKCDFIINKSPDEIIEAGIKEGIFIVHLELGEWYYHTTESGRALLKCTCCGGDRFEDDECKNPPLKLDEIECEYGDPDCCPDDDYELMCDEHRGDYSADIGDRMNDRD